MSDLPKSASIQEEGPREGFQIEKGPITTDRKVELIDALAETGLKQIQIVSFVSPTAVPQMADADEVVRRFKPKDGVRFTALWLNNRGFERALMSGRLYVRGTIALTASETFLERNQRRTLSENLEEQRAMIKSYKDNGVPIDTIAIMAAFGCNFEGEIAPARVVDMIGHVKDLGSEQGVRFEKLTLADTMAWATPLSIKRLVGMVRERYSDLRINLHLHDTRGMGIANAYAGLEMGVDSFDAAVGGLGGCPFAAHSGAAGNVCTEDLVLMCEEMGIATGVDLDHLLEVARLAEDIVGHPLPGAVKQGGSLGELRRCLTH